MIAVLIVALSLAGLVISIYFTLAYYGRIKKAGWVPEILCAREGSNCVTVVQTPYARVLGLPNSLLGMIYYLALLTWLLLPRNDVHCLETHYLFVFLTGKILVGFSGAAVLLGCYLVYALRRKLRINCPLCYAVHAMNLALLVLLVLQLW